MPADALAVILEDRPIGELVRLRDGTLRLRTADDYNSSAEATPLSVSMPSAARSQPDTKIRPWLWGLLPDNGDVLERWGRDFAVSIASPYSLLGTQIGHDCAGAVQFCPPAEVDQLLTRGGDIEWLSEADIADRLRALRADSTTWLGPGLTGQFSLGGAQAKTALRNQDGQWGVPTGDEPTTHIIKIAMQGLDEQDLNEHLCLLAAREAGLKSVETRLVRFEDQQAVVVTRFDRLTTTGGLTRVHQEDLCQALSLHPARKYQADGGPSPGRIAELLRGVMLGPTAEVDVWRFADALVFNWLIAGTDAHAKNYSLLLDGGHVRLAPIYDLSSYLPYDESKGHKLKLAMKLGNRYRLLPDNCRQAWEKTADELKLDQTALIQRVVDLAQSVPKAFAVAAEDPATLDLDTDLPARLAEMVEQRCAVCTSGLD